MIQVRQGRVLAIKEEYPDVQFLRVLCGGQEADAVNYPAITGQARSEDQVTLNTTAVELGLGTGGMHFVMAIQGQEREIDRCGHIMKARYTPTQVRVQTVEEPESVSHATMADACHLDGMPVAVATLHSLIAPFAVAFKQLTNARLAYIMTDAAALPAAFSGLLRTLKNKGFIDVVITCGHAFGGDIEAVTAYSALHAAREVAHSEACIVAMGPGVVGTQTPLGTTALEQAPLLDGAGALGARTVAIPRISFADARVRHHGVSQHTLTALGRLTQLPTTVVLPALSQEHKALVLNQLHDAAVVPKHRLAWEQGDNIAALLDAAGVKVTTMGRTPQDDPVFFATGAAAGRYVAQVTCN
jgi:DNA-directed RNA polymerase subunit H (RpoH/RPB5)